MQDGMRHMECTECKYKWIAICYETSERLKCPNCGYMVQVPPSLKEG